MLDRLRAPAADSILALMGAFRDDPRGDKLDLGVGVWRDADGGTPVMRAVKVAERRLVETQFTKSYTGLAGDPAFTEAMAGLLLGPSRAGARIAAAATPGGTGGIRQGLELIRMAAPDARIWLPDPTWPNHRSIVGYLGAPQRDYRYYDTETGRLDFDGMLADLDGLAPGDVVLLHGCCHNPTGVDPTPDQWQAIADVLLRKRALPFVDIAYQGFGDGLDADASGLRALAASLPNVLVAASCSKTFGLYRERAGLVIGLVETPSHAPALQATLAHLNRQNYSFPPDHGARVVTMILEDDALRADWAGELEGIRTRLGALRGALADELAARSGSERFAALATHRGMFSRIGATIGQVTRLREEHGIYMVDDGRINVAGLTTEAAPRLAQALLDVGI